MVGDSQRTTVNQLVREGWTFVRFTVFREVVLERTDPPDVTTHCVVTLEGTVRNATALEALEVD